MSDGLKFHPGPPRSDSVLLRLFPVFLTPMGDHYRTRLTHTLEVSQNARTIAKALRLNEDLVEAIALGHDLGHTPFGHAGEFLLNQVYEGGFRHNEQSVRIVEKPASYFSVSGKTYCAGYGHGPSERPDEYHTAVPPCLCPLNLWTDRRTDLKYLLLSVLFFPELSYSAHFCGTNRQNPYNISNNSTYYIFCVNS